MAEFRVSKHIREVQKEFNNLKTQQSYINKKFINVYKSVSVVDHDIKRLAVEMNIMGCVQALILQQADINVRIQKWIKKLEQIFDCINKGYRCMPHRMMGLTKCRSGLNITKLWFFQKYSLYILLYTTKE